MLDNPVLILEDYVSEAIDFYTDLIRGENLTAFTRLSKVSRSQLLYQMLNRRGWSQWAEVDELKNSIDNSVNMTDKGFFLARRKFNPEAVRVMSNEYIANIYDNYDDSIDKYKGLVFLAIDGSKCTLPTTKQNIEVFGRCSTKKNENQPAMCLMSTLHDTINDLKLDMQIDRINGSERALALKHVDFYCDNYTQKGLFTNDRGYPSIRLMDHIDSKGQYFMMRTPSTAFKSCFDQVGVNEDKELDLTYDTASTNEYRNDRQFRQYLLNTTFHYRFAKIVIDQDDDDNDVVEMLVTNLPKDKFRFDELKDIYRRRWVIETSYNHMKNKMKMEEFSGYSPELIKQDLYADMWMYNLVSLKIKYANEQKPIEQKEEGEYRIKRNFNKVIGTMKRHLLKALMADSEAERNRELQIIDANISESLTWVKKGNRVFERKSPVNKSAISYRKTY